jgi:predicted RNA-binding protein associated with RNAse of E/G family
MDALTIIKLNANDQETWRYSSRVLEQSPAGVLVEARFNREDLLFYGVQLKKDDRFLELYLTDRWYNIFEIHDRDDDHLKAYYCNVASPAWLENDCLYFKDLALDLLVFPDGRQLVLDEDEFEELDPTPAMREQADQALQTLKDLFTQMPRPNLSALLINPN